MQVEGTEQPTLTSLEITW